MKLKNIALTALMLVAFSGASFAQSEEEEAQLFGSTRGSKFQIVEMGKLESVPVCKEITIENKTSNTLEFSSIELPAGVNAMPKSKQIAAGEKSVVLLTVYPEIAGNVSKKTVVIRAKKQGDSEGKPVEYKFQLKSE